MSAAARHRSDGHGHSHRQCVSCKRHEIDKRDHKAKADKLCAKCFKATPRRTCTHCLKHFSAVTDAMRAHNRCRKCEDDIEIHGVPHACSWCQVPGAFGTDNLCRHCKRNTAQFGAPTACEMCGLVCAFRKRDATAVDNKLLCYGCTFKYKEARHKAKGGTGSPADSDGDDVKAGRRRKHSDSSATAASAAAPNADASGGAGDANGGAAKRLKSDASDAAALAASSSSASASASGGAAKGLQSFSVAAASASSSAAAASASGGGPNGAAHRESSGGGGGGGVARGVTHDSDWLTLVTTYESLLDAFEDHKSLTESRLGEHVAKALTTRLEFASLKDKLSAAEAQVMSQSQQLSKLNGQLLELQSARTHSH